MKTGTDNRTIDQAERTVATLPDWRRVREEDAALAASTVVQDEAVLAGLDDNHTHPFRLGYDRKLATSDVPRTRFHDLRFTHPTILVKADVQVTVDSVRLAHSSHVLAASSGAPTIPL